MDLQVTDKALKEVACDALVVGAIRSKAEQNTNGVVLSKAAKEVDAVLGGLLSEICSGGEFRGSLGEMTTIYTMGKLTAKRVIVVGLGPQDTMNAQSLRRASAIATRSLQQTGARQAGRIGAISGRRTCRGRAGSTGSSGGCSTGNVCIQEVPPLR